MLLLSLGRQVTIAIISFMLTFSAILTSKQAHADIITSHQFLSDEGMFTYDQILENEKLYEQSLEALENLKKQMKEYGI